MSRAVPVSLRDGRLKRAISSVASKIFALNSESIRRKPLLFERLEPRTLLSNGPITFQPIRPLGSGIYQANASGTFTGKFIGDSYNFTLAAGEKLSAEVIAGDPSEQPQIDVVSSDYQTVYAANVAAQLGGTAVVEEVSLPAAGAYHLVVTTDADPGTGPYTLQADLNALLDTPGGGATAEDLTPSSLPLNGTADRLAVVGNTGNGSTQTYGFQLSKGEAASIALASKYPGSGNFQPLQYVSAQNAPIAVATGDFNGDGFPDIVSVGTDVNGDGAPIDILLNDGTGNFSIAHSYPQSLPATAVAVGDFDGDGNLDIAVTESDGSTSRLVIFQGNGDGSFNQVRTTPLAAVPVGIVAADFGTGVTGIAVAEDTGNGTRVDLFQATNGNIYSMSAPYATYFSDVEPSGIAAGDLNNDGANDLAISDSTAGSTVTLLMNNADGTGTFAPPQTLDFGTPALAVAIGNMDNGPGNSLVYLPANVPDNQAHVDVITNDGSGDFATLFATPGRLHDSTLGGVPFTAGSAIALGDFNRDGNLDVVVTGGTGTDQVSTAFNGGDGTVYENEGWGGIGFASGVAVADFSNTGQPGFVTAANSYNDIVVVQGRGNLNMNLTDAIGNTLVNGQTTTTADESVYSFVAPADGTYYASVSGDANQPFALDVTRGALIRNDPDNLSASNTPQDITFPGQTTGYLDFNNNETQSFGLQVNAGDALSISTLTPTDGPDANTLVPQISLYDANGNLVASNSNGAADGTNALLNYLVPANAGGGYTVSITAVSGTGEYILNASGSTAAPANFVITSSYPSSTGANTGVPSAGFFLNQQLLITSVNPALILLNGQPIAGQYGGPDYLFFSVPGDGTYTVNVQAGAFLSASGAPIQPFTFTFTVDNGPQVVSTSISPGQVISPGNFNFTVGFDRPLEAEIVHGIFGDNLIQPRDFSLINESTGQAYPVGQILYDTVDQYNDPSQLTLEFGNLPEGAYQLTLLHDDLVDENFVSLDGAGNNSPGTDYVLDFQVHRTGVIALPDWTPSAPVGSLTAQSSIDAAYSAGNQTNTYSFTAAPGETISIALIPTSPLPQTQVTLTDPNSTQLAQVTSDTNGDGVIIENIATTTGGTYQLNVADLSSALGAYTIRVLINGVYNPSLVSGTPAPAPTDNLDSSFAALTGSSALATVVGNAVSTSNDTYQLTLTAGQTITAALAAQNADGSFNDNQTLSLQLRGPNGILLAVGGPVSGTASEAIEDFAVPSTGVYTLTVAGAGGYGLTIARNAAIALANDTSTVGPQDISVTHVAVGNVQPAAGNPIRVAEIVATAGAPDGFATELTNDGIQATGVTQDQVSTLSALDQYDVVVLGTAGSITYTSAFSSALAAWVNQGHALIITGLFYNYSEPAFYTPLDAISPIHLLTQDNGGFLTTGDYSYTSTTSPITANLSAIQGVQSAVAIQPNPNATVLATLNGRATIASQIVGNFGRSVFLGLFYQGGLTGTADQLLVQAIQWAAQAGPTAVPYSFGAAAGDHLTINVSAPTDIGGNANQLEPVITLLDSHGNVVATAGNTGNNTGNATINYTVPAGDGGSYQVVISAATSNGGDYVLSFAGANGATSNVGPSVVSTSIANGTAFRIAPTTLTFSLSKGIRADQVSINNLQISNGATVTGFNIIDGTDVQYTINVPVVAGQLVTYTYSLAAGTFTDLQGNPSAAYSGNFVVDMVGPRVVSTSPQTQTFAPFSSITFTFSKPLDPNYLYSPYYLDSFTGPGGVDLSQYAHSATISGNLLTFTFAPQTAPGNYTIIIGPGLRDLLGNTMDQNGNGINGEAGDTYTAVVDVGTPNLTAESITAPTAGQFGSSVNVQWTVTNTGGSPTGSAWVDKVYLANGTSVDANSVLLGSFSAPSGSLAAGASYTQNESISLPTPGYYLAGNYNIIVVVNATNSQLDSNSADNSIATPISLTQPTLPDLTPVQFSAPANPQYGSQITATWIDQNNGQTNFSGALVDQVYLSTTPTLTNSAVSLGTVAYDGVIPPGASIPQSLTFTLPNGYTGSYYLLVKTDYQNLITESNKLNNVASLPLTIGQSPDLTVSSITVPANGYSGRALTVQWTDANTGPADATGTFADNVYYSSSNSLADATFAGQFIFTGTVSAGGSIQRIQTIQIPPNLSGPTWIIITTNVNGGIFETDRSNNTTASPQPVAVQLSAFPNLVVENLVGPSTIFSGQTTQVSWTVANTGYGSTNSQQWYDRVYINNSPDLNGFPTLLAQVPNQSYLNPGDQYNSSVNVTIPVGYQGTYYFVVNTDAGNQVVELAIATSKVTASGPVNVALTQPPDITVHSITVAPELFSGQPTTLSYTVLNTGPGPTRSTETGWYDAVYISTSPTIDGSATLLESIPHSGGLAVNQQYSVSTSVTLPIGISGNYYIIVEADSNGAVFEAGFQNDNTNSTPVQVLLTPPPDLAVTAVTAPLTALASHELQVAYTVSNLGATITPNTYWDDRLLLSPTPTLNLATAFAFLDIVHNGQLGTSAGNDSYTSSFDVTVPNGFSGTYYVFVLTDALNQVFELDRSNSSLAAAQPIVISSKPADLQVTAIAGATSAVSGLPLNINWTVTNEGTGDTAVTNWSDELYLSTSPTLGAGIFIDLGPFAHNGLLNAGASYTESPNVSVPFSVATGTYYLFVYTDIENQVYEGANEGNNVNAFTAPISISQNPPSLEVTQVTAPTVANAGTPITVSWTVQNAGTGAANSSYWYDTVYLSTSPSLSNSSSVIALGNVAHVNGLGAGQQYTATATLQIPTGVNGDYFVVVASDSGQYVTESPARVNGTLASTNVVAVSPYLPDLTVSNVTAPSNATAGLLVNVSWTVSNTGSGPAYSNDYGGGWYDTVYLSADAALDPQTATALGSVFYPALSTAGALAAGAQYTVNSTFQLPNGISGTYYIIVDTDSSGRVVEQSKTDNALAASPTLITLQPPIDLVAGTLTIPANASPGLSTTITYMVTNNSAQIAYGGWADALYLSPTPTFNSATAVLFGEQQHLQTLQAFSSYTATITAPLPGILPGNYYVILRSDVKDQIPETDKTNNISASLTAVSIDTPVLTLDVPSTASPAQGSSLYYKITVEAGQSLVIALSGSNSNSVNTLYASFGQVPSASTHDFQFSNPISSSQVIIVPTTQAGTYYILGNATTVIGSDPISILATEPQFSIVDTSYGLGGIGGNGGNLTLQINGTKFDRTDTATLTGPGNTSIAASAYYWVSANRFYATFNLLGVMPGEYTLTATNSAGAVATVSNGLKVINTPPPSQIKPVLEGPARVSAGKNYNYRVVWANGSYNDAPAPLIDVNSSAPFNVSPLLSYGGKTFEEVYGTTNDDGPPGIIRPGQSYGETFYTVAGGGHVDITAGEQYTSLSDPFDWSTVYSQIIPAGMSDAQFTPIFNRLIQEDGSTWGAFLSLLSRTANLLPAAVGDADDYGNELGIEVQRVEAELGTSIAGNLFNASYSVGIAGRGVIATNTTTGDIFSAFSLNDGSFVFPAVTPGSYVISVDGSTQNSVANVTVNAGQAVTGASLAVVAGSSLAGTVIDAVTDTAIQGALLTATDSAGNITLAQTDSNGFYDLSGLPADTYTLTVSGAGYAPQTVGSIVVGTSTSTVENFQLTGGGSILGVVATSDGALNDGTLSVTAQPSPLTSSGVAFTTQIDGQNFTIPSLPPGTYTINFSQYGYQLVSMTVVINSASQIVNLGTVTLPKQILVSGTLTSSVPSISADSVRVVALQNGNVISQTLTDTQGNFLFTDLTPGSYTLEALPDSGGVPTSYSLTVAAAQNVTGVILSIGPGTNLSGNVAIGGSGSPAGLVVKIVDSSGFAITTLTDDSGNYQFPGIPSGSYTISAAGGAPVSFTIPAGAATFTENLTVSTTTSLSGVVETSTGQPVANATVDLIYQGVTIDGASTDANGYYNFTIYSPGAFDLQASASSGSFATVTSLNVGLGQNVTQDLIGGSSSLAVTVSPSTASLAGATAILSQSGPEGLVQVESATADSTGTFSFTGLVTGTYEIDITGIAGFGAQQTLTVSGASTAVVALQAVHSVSGLVTDSVSGQPAEFAAVLIAATDGSYSTETVTDATGAYSVAGLQANTYQVSIISPGYLTSVQTITLSTTDVVVNSTLTPGAPSITGTVLNGTLPVAGATVYLLDASDNMLGFTTTAADGTFAITGAAGANLSLIVSPLGYAQFQVSLPNIPAAGVAVGNIAVQQITGGSAAGQGTPGSTSSSGTASPASSPQSGPALPPTMGADDGVSSTLLISFLSNFNVTIANLKSLIDLGNEGAVQLSDIPLCPTDCRPSCYPAYLKAVSAVNNEQMWLNNLQSNVNAYDYQIPSAIAALSNDVIQNVNTIATVAFGLTEIAAKGLALLSYAGLQKTSIFFAGDLAKGELPGFVDTISNGGTILAKNSRLAVITLLGYLTQFSTAFYPAAQAFVKNLESLTDPNDLRSAVDKFLGFIDQERGDLLNAATAFVGIIGGEPGLIQGAKSLNYGPGGPTGLLGLVGLITGYQGVLDNASFKESLNQLDELERYADIARGTLVKLNVAKSQARSAWGAYLNCLANCGKTLNDLKTPPTWYSFLSIFYPISLDPNSISGPTGFGPAQIVSTSQPLNYQISFENDPTALGAAQHVRIVMPLDPSFDPRTFRLGNIQIGSQVIDIGSNVAFYQGQLDLTATLGVLVDIVAGVDVANHEAFWDFQAIDPATGLSPSDPLVGLLPPDVDGLSGQGTVTYSISPIAGVQSGQAVAAQATVFFDNNAPIDTGIWTNAFDAVAPTSAVASLPVNENDPSFNVSWSGTDDANGSGIAGYNVFVSVNGGPFSEWLTDTANGSAIYTGISGDTYSFFSQAIDNAGNVEATPTSAEATTTVGEGQATLTGLAGNVAVTYGTSTTTFTGTVTGSPLAGEMVAVTLNGVTVNAVLDGSGDFSAMFNTSALPASATPYAVTYVYAGDANLGGVSDTTSTTLSVNPAIVVVTIGNASKVYGSADPTFTVGYGGFANGDSASALSGTLSFATSEPASGNANVGSYRISGSGLSSGNYAIQYVAGTLSVTPASLTISANPLVIAYGQPIPALTAGYRGFVGGDSAASLTTPPTLGTGATSTSAVGPYAITIGGAVDANYTIAYVPGTLTIAPATPAIVLNPPGTLVYDGTGDVLSWVNATLGGAGNGAAAPTGAIAYTYYTGTSASGAPLATPPINPGAYTVLASYAGDSNYTAAQTSVTFTITRQAAPLNASIQLDDGAAQRSMIRGITIAFTSAVTLGTGAIALVDGNGNPVAFAQHTADNTTFTLTFSGIGGSLPDGRYTVIVHAALVNASGGPKLDFDHTLSFWRLFGDFYGAGTVTNADKALYTQAYKGQSPSTVPYADYDGNGVLNSVDTNAFSANLGKTEVSPPQNLNTIGGTSGNDTIVLTLDPDHQHIDWSMSYTAGGFATGRLMTNDPAGLTINGNGGTDVIELNYANGNPLPSIMHLNGTFFLDGLSGTNPFAGTTLDINQSTLYITYGAVDPLAMIQSYLKSGCNNGQWNGTPTANTGVITSRAAQQDSSASTGIGYVDSAGGLIPGMPADTIELKYTLYGDTGLTGSVGFTDFMRLTQHFATSQYGSWTAGDFNYDGSVNASDFAMLSANYGKTLPAPAFAPAAPTTAANTTPSTPPTPPATRTPTLPPPTATKLSPPTPTTLKPPARTANPSTATTPAPGSGKTAPSKSAAPKTTSIKVQTPIAPPTPAEPKKPAGKVVSKVVELIATPTKDAKARPAMKPKK